MCKKKVVSQYEQFLEHVVAHNCILSKMLARMLI